MRYLLLIAIMAGALLCSVPVQADSGVSVTLTTTVTGDSGGGGGFISPSNGSVPYTPPNWSTIFPLMNQPQSSAYLDNRPVQNNPPIPIPPVVGMSSNVVTEPTIPAVTPVPTTPVMDRAVWAGIAFWAIVVGLFVWFLSWLVDRKRKKQVQ